MENLRLLHALAFPVLAFLSALRASTQPSHRAVAALFAVYAVSDLSRLALGVPLDAQPPPYHDVLLVAYYTDNAVYLAHSIACASVIAVHFVGVAPRWPVLVWAVLVAAFVVWKEATGLPSLQFQEVVSSSATLLACVAVARAVLAPSERMIRPDSSHVVLLLLLATDVVRSTVFRVDQVLAGWLELRAVNVTVQVLIAVFYVLVRERARSRWKRTS